VNLNNPGERLNTNLSYIFGKEADIMPVVILKMRKGWTTEQKRRIVKEFTNTLVATLKIDPDLVTIMIDEHSLEDIGHGGVLRCDEH
jgi:4-oxalocrotonate tautomerase